MAVLGLGLAASAGSEVMDITHMYKAGEHVGERKQLDVDIRFSGSYGTTVTNAGGINYNFWGISIHEDKVYPPQYWGSFPLYFFGTRVGVEVTVTNKGPRATEKLRVTTQAFCLNTDGSSGVRLAQDNVQEFWVNKGETKVIDASFVAQYVAGAESGLDRVVVLVQHVNEGGDGRGNPYPALIMAKEAILCPPDVEAQGKGQK